MSLETVDFSQLQLKPEQRLLDLGCGEGRHSISAWLREELEVVGLDLGLTDIKTARSRLADFPNLDNRSGYCAFVAGSGLSLPFADATFDHVICSEVLEHIHDYQPVLGEIARVVKPGGSVTVSVPRYFPEWVCWQLSDAYHEVKGGHIRIFKARDLSDAIQALGMQPTARHWAHALHVPYWWLKCLFWGREPEHFLVRQYHRLLVWDLMQKPWLTRTLDRFFNPILGKSIVMYFRRPGSTP